MSTYIDEDTGEVYEDFEEERFCQELSTKFLAVVTEKGRLLLESRPYLTLIKVIEFVGVDKVANLGLKACEELPLISQTRITARDYQPIGTTGWLVYTSFNLKGKVAIIEKIGELTGHKFTCATKRVII